MMALGLTYFLKLLLSHERTNHVHVHALNVFAEFLIAFVLRGSSSWVEDTIFDIIRKPTYTESNFILSTLDRPSEILRRA